MSAYRTGWPEDEYDDGSGYLPPEDGGAEVMLPDVGDIEVMTGAEMPPEQREQMQADEAEIAMRRLRQRIAERDSPPGLALGDPMGGIVDPWAQTQGGQLAPAPIPTAAVPPATPTPAVPLAPGMATPPPLPAPAPAMPTATDAPPDATTAPQAPTVTAGSQAQGLAQQAPQRNPMAPTNAPQFAMGATGLGGAQAGMSQRVAAGEAAPNSYDRQLEAARAEDTRRNRWRAALKGLAALMGMRTIASGGSAGGAVPGLIAAGMVRPGDEVATLQGRDAREQEIGTEAARRQAMMDQLAQRRAAQEATERNQQQTLALRMQELQGDQADRQLRTQFMGEEAQRDAARVDPASGRSAQMRQALVRFARTLPPEVRESVLAGDISGLSAEEAERLMLSLGGVESGRQRGGGGSGATSRTSGGAATVAGGDFVAPPAFVAAQAQIRGESPEAPSQASVQAANLQWQAMSEGTRASWASSDQGRAMAAVIGRSLPGYQQSGGGAITPEQYAQARAAQSTLASFDTLVESAAQAGDAIEELPADRQAAVRAGDLVGLELDDNVSAFNDARVGLVGILNQMANAGVLSESEREAWMQQLPSISDFRGNVSGTTRRMRAIQRRVRAQVEANMQVLGYRRTEGATGTPPTTTTPQPGATPAPPSEHRVTLTFRRGSETRSQAVPRNLVDRAIAAGQRQGWEVVQ